MRRCNSDGPGSAASKQQHQQRPSLLLQHMPWPWLREGPVAGGPGVQAASVVPAGCAGTPPDAVMIAVAGQPPEH